MKTQTQRRRLYFAHAYGYAAAISQQLRTAEGRADLLKWIDASCPAFRAAVIKPVKAATLHVLIHDLAFFDWEHEVTHSRLETLDQFFADHDETIPSRLRRHTNANQEKLSDRLERPLAQLFDGVFYLLFGDRDSLFRFNEMIATKIREPAPRDIPEMRRPGVLVRPSYIPVWLRKAMFHRDKGRCQVCRRDLTGLLNPVADAQFDHLWPLVRSGSNNVTNFQLLCARCNSKKHAEGGTSRDYYVYW